MVWCIRTNSNAGEEDEEERERGLGQGCCFHWDYRKVLGCGECVEEGFSVGLWCRACGSLTRGEGEGGWVRGSTGWWVLDSHECGRCGATVGSDRCAYVWVKEEEGGDGNEGGEILWFDDY